MHQRQLRSGAGALTATFLLGLSLLAPSAHAARPAGELNVVPTITNIQLVDGQLLASGVATATLNGRTFTAPFSGVPVNIALAENQLNAPPGCPILDLQLGPIQLDLLGLVVETSPICLQITAYEGGGLLGDLLCSVANLLNQGIPLDQILAGLGDQLNTLTTALTDLLNAALDNLGNAVLTNVAQANGPNSCAVLNLALGPLDLNLLGLEVILDNCNNGPVTVDITARRGALLGNLLCSLAGSGQLTLGTILDDILGQLLALAGSRI